MSDELNSTENSQVFSLFAVGFASVYLALYMFGLFAGCCNSHLVALDQCWETTFLFGALSTCCVIYSLLFSQVFVFVFFLQSCVVHYFVIVVFLGSW